jgi:DNA-binding NtrC family response regulator
MSVLIIDDEQIILDSLAVIFKRKNIAAETENNPVEALQRYRRHHYNIVLVDVLMPEMNGVDVVRTIKQINPLCNIIVMTAFSNMMHVVDCIEAGAVDYITKPFSDMDILLNVVRTTIERVERWSASFGLKRNCEQS